MSTVVAALVSFFIVIGVAFAASGWMFDVIHSKGESWTRSVAAAHDVAQSSTTVASASACRRGDTSSVFVTLRNEGTQSHLNYSDWDAIIHYTGPGVPLRILRAPYIENIQIDTWTVDGIFLDEQADEPELREPGVFNPGEELRLVIVVQPRLANNSWAWVKVTPAPGAPSEISFFYGNAVC